MANRDFKVRHGLNVCGNSSLGGNVAISGNLDVGGNLSLESADLSGALQVSGSASLGSLRVAGMTSLDGGLVVRGSMSVAPTIHAGNISASGNLQVNGTTSLKNTLTVSGMTSLQGGLVVDTSMDVQTKLNADTISASGNLTVDGTTSLNGALTVSGTASFKGDLSISGSLQIGGAGGSGVGIATNVNLGSTLTVSDNTDLNGNLTVSGTTTLSGGVQALSGLDVSGNVQATGHVSAGGFLHAGTTLQVSGSASIGSLKVAGMTSLQGGLVVDTSMDVQTSIQANNISSSGTLFIGGSTNPHIELSSNTSGTPYIDFGRQVGGQGQDYGGRIILDGDTTLSICAQQLHFGAQNICLDGTVRSTGDVCFQTFGYIKQGLAVGQNTGTIGQYDTILVGERRGAGGTGDAHSSITLHPGSFGSKIDGTPSFTSIWTNKNGVATARFDVRFGTSTEQIRLRPRGQDVLVASSTCAGVRSVAICGSLGVSGATSLGSLRVGGTTCLQNSVNINATLSVAQEITATGGIHAVAGNIQTTGTISGSQLKFVSANGQRMTVSNLDSVSGRVGTLSATKFNFTSAGGQRINISSATITSLNVSTITVNQQGNIARRISGTVASNNSSYVTAFTVNGNNLASCVEVFFEGSISNVVVSCYAEIVVNHSGDITIRTHQGNYTPLDIQVISNNNEDFAVLVKRNGGVAGTANLNFNVYPKGDETVTATSTNPYSGTTFTHTGVRGTKITATGGQPHRFETDGEIIGKQTLTVSGLTSLQGGLVVDTSMNVQTLLQADNISSSGTLKVQGTTTLSGATQIKNTLSVAGSTVLSGAVQAKNTLSVGGSGTIAGVSFDKGWVRIGDANGGIAMDPNEIYFAGTGNIGTLSGNLALNPAGSITTGKVFDSTANIQTTAIISGTQLRCTSFAGTTADVAGTLQVSGLASLGSLKVTNTTCLQGSAIVNQELKIKNELDFIGATNKYVDFMLVSSNAATFNANFRSVNHNSQGHHTHLVFNRGAAVDLYHNNNLKAATRSTGFYVSGTLCATQDVKVAGQLRAAGAVSVDGSAHVAQALQVGGQVSVGGILRTTQSIRTAGQSQTNANGIGGIAIYGSSISWNGISITGPGATKTLGIHYGGQNDNTLRIGRYQKAASITQTGNYEANPVMIDMDNGNIITQGTVSAAQDVKANGQLRAGGGVSAAGNSVFKAALSVSGTLSAGKYNFEPYGVVPAYSNSNYGTIKYHSTESAIELSSSSDTSIGMAFPAWKVNVNPGNKWQITMQIRASANTTGGVYIRVYEYDAELPAGKIAVSNDAANALVQEDTRRNVTSPQYENVNGSTNWQTVTLEYTPTSTAVWASIVVLNWTGLGTNALYVREPQVNMIIESINIGSNVQVTGHVSADGYGHFGQSLQVCGTISGQLLTAGTVRGNVICAQQQLITNQQLITRGNLFVSGGSVLSGTTSFRVVNGWTHWQGTAQRRSLVAHNNGNAWYMLVTGQQDSANVSFNSWRPFYVSLSNAETFHRTKSNFDQISASQQVVAAGDLYAGGQVRAAGALSCNGSAHVAQGLQVGGTASINALRVAGVLSAQGGLVIDSSFDCQIIAQFNNISCSDNLRVDGQISAQGSILAGQTLRAGGNLCGQGNGFVNQNFKVGGTTCLQGTTVVNGSLQPRGELDFIGATNKYVDFMLVSSNQQTYNAHIRSMNHNSQGHHLHIVMNRGAAVDLYHNNNLKAATRSGGFYVSGTLSVVQDVKAGGQIRASGALSCDGGGHFSQGVQICGTVSCTALHAGGGTIQTTGVISGNTVVGQTLQYNTRINGNGQAQYDKLRVWSSSEYAIGMNDSMTAGRLNDYAMTFTMNNDADRGFVFRHSAMNKAQAAISITVSGRTTIAHGLRVGYGVNWQGNPGENQIHVAGDCYAGAQLRAAGACSVNGGGHFGQGIQVCGSISCNGLHAAGSTIQTTGAISGGQLLTGGQVLAGGKVRGSQVCAQNQCLVNQQLRVNQGSILNGTVSIKTANGTTHWVGQNNRRSAIWRNDGGNYYLLITGQQNNANTSWNGWRPFRVNLSNADVVIDTTLYTENVIASGSIQCKRKISAVCGYGGGGADFAEYFEWADGNPNVSDRVGRSVVVTGSSGKIGIATAGQTPFGVVTGRAAFVGNTAGSWHQRYLKDEYMRTIKDENGDDVPNPEFNSACTYFTREQRAEWDPIGMLGKISIRVGEVLNPNWMKLRVISPTVEEYLVR